MKMADLDGKVAALDFFVAGVPFGAVDVATGLLVAKLLETLDDLLEGAPLSGTLLLAIGQCAGVASAATGIGGSAGHLNAVALGGAGFRDEAAVANGARKLLGALNEVESDAAVHVGVVADGFPPTIRAADGVEDLDPALLDARDVCPESMTLGGDNLGGHLRVDRLLIDRVECVQEGDAVVLVEVGRFELSDHGLSRLLVASH